MLDQGRGAATLTAFIFRELNQSPDRAGPRKDGTTSEGDRDAAAGVQPEYAGGLGSF